MDAKFVFKIISLTIDKDEDEDVFQRKATLVIALQRWESSPTHRSNGYEWHIVRKKFYNFTNTFSGNKNTKEILAEMLSSLTVESFMVPIFAPELKDPNRTITNAKWSVEYTDGFRDYVNIIDDNLKIVLNDHLAEIVSYN